MVSGQVKSLTACIEIFALTVLSNLLKKIRMELHRRYMLFLFLIVLSEY